MTEDSNESMPAVVLDDTFSVHGSGQRSYRLKLSTTHLTITTNDNDSNSSASTSQIIAIDDLYGCLTMKPKKNQIQSHLVLYLYYLQKPKGFAGALSKKDQYHRKEKIFTYDKFDNFDSNFTQTSRWSHTILQLMFICRQIPVSIAIRTREKPALVFVNPAGGAGKAHRLVMEFVIGVWSEAQFSHKIIVTEYAGHARDFVKTINVNDWSGIVLASGDGLIYEVINGLMSREDWYNALQLPIGHLPCGSGNAFITNVIHHSKQHTEESMTNFVIQAAVLITRHQIIPFDLAMVDICDGRRLFSFLCIEWGIIADVDCDSEQYRFLGGARFTVEAVKRILQPRVYHGYIDYIPHDDSITSEMNDSFYAANPPVTQLHRYVPPLNTPIDSNATANPWRRIQGPFAHVLITSKQCISKDVVASPKSNLSDGFLTLQFIRSDGSTRLNLAKTFTKLSNGKHFDYDFVEWMPIRAFRIVPEGTEGNMMVDGEKIPYGPIQGETLPKAGKCMGKQPCSA